MKWTRILLAVALAAPAGALVGCGDDDGDTHVDAGRDSGPPPADTGTTEDTGTAEDTGTGEDSGPPDGGMMPTPNVRLAHLIPNQGSIRICVDTIVGGMPVGTTVLLPGAMTAAGGIPHRGVSQYVDTFPAGLDYQIKVYDQVTLDAWNEMTAGDERCPVSMDVDPPAPVVTADVGATELVGGNSYTLAFVGFLPDGDGTPADLCGVPPTFEGVPCMEAQNAKLVILDDDTTTPAAGMTELRFVQAIPDLPPIDVCFDPDGGGAMPAEVIFNDVGFIGTAAMHPTYITRAPITAGAISFHLNMMGVPDCLMATAIGMTAVPFPAPVGTAMIPGSIATFADEHTITLFGSGNAGGPDPATGGNGATFIPFIDAAPAAM